MNNLSQILSLKYHIYGNGKYKDQKNGVKYCFLFVSHLLTLSYTVFLQHSSDFYTRFMHVAVSDICIFLI